MKPLILVVALSGVWCQKASLQVATYFDSNVDEALTETVPTVGFKLRGNLNHRIITQDWQIDGNILTQTYLDAILPTQSKLVVNSGLGLRYFFTPALQAVGGLNHFQKAFYDQGPSYRWTDYALNMRHRPADKLSIGAGWSHRTTNYTSLDSIKFLGRLVELRIGYHLTQNWLLEGLVRNRKTTFRDYPAQGVLNDTTLVQLGRSQRDDARSVQFHTRYQGKMIVGASLRYEQVTSNSVTGGFNLLNGRAYLSCRLGKTTMLHFIIQRVDKNYRRGDLSGVTAYRDPEERIQNRTYLQLERQLKPSVIGYLQMSHLANETLVNQRYYNKTMLELGIKFKL